MCSHATQQAVYAEAEAMLDLPMSCAGAYPPRVRILPTNHTPNPSRFSGSDGCSSSLFPEESPSCCSSSAGGNAWPAVGTEDGPSVAVSSLGPGQGWGSRGSLRYGSPTTATAQQRSGQRSFQTSRDGSSSAGAQRSGRAQGVVPAPAPGSVDSKPAGKGTLRARWTNWITGSPRARTVSSQNLQIQQDQQTQQGAGAPSAPSAAWLAHSRAASHKRGTAAASSAPGNAAAQALYNSTGGYASAASGFGPGGPPVHQLLHCHSNPELVQAAATGSVGHGSARPQFQRTSALGGGVPPCARSLFGSMPQMERPLMMGGSVGNGSSNNSSGWLSGPGGVGFGGPVRSESFGVLATLGMCDDAMSVASGKHARLLESFLASATSSCVVDCARCRKRVSTSACKGRRASQMPHDNHLRKSKQSGARCSELRPQCPGRTMT